MGVKQSQKSNTMFDGTANIPCDELEAITRVSKRGHGYLQVEAMVDGSLSTLNPHATDFSNGASDTTYSGSAFNDTGALRRHR